MFQTTRRRLALWYTGVTAILLLLFASGFYLYVRTTLVERIDDTLNHVVEIVERSLVIEPATPTANAPLVLNVEASFRNNWIELEDDHIDLEWFSPMGDLLWSTFSQPIAIPLRISSGETVHLSPDFLLRQVTQRVQADRQVLGYLRVSHPWFEVTKPSRQLIRDLSLGTVLTVGAVGAIGWLLSGLAIARCRDSYQRLKQFTADASHELRNPIAIIQTNVQVALSDPNPDPVLQQQQLKVVERLTRRLGRLVDDLLFLARQDSGMITLQKEGVALDELLVEVVEEQQVMAIDNHVALRLQVEGDEDPDLSFTLQGDRDQLIRLFTNLISNAIQYTPAQGTIYLTLKRVTHPPQLTVDVQDTGVGIPAESLPRLFDRFYRVDPARSRDGVISDGKTGSGLGLAIAKVIVENHQGQIQATSEFGKGTTFTVTLPGEDGEPVIIGQM
ncbi:MAG: sensor histidine kinase [Leptolyngbyaceae cyanobacterium SL_7_1]|nr:sensor histidine kinase [Leptolyngbyaceae cyanobacterium SL_7_1]